MARANTFDLVGDDQISPFTDSKKNAWQAASSSLGQAQAANTGTSALSGGSTSQFGSIEAPTKLTSAASTPAVSVPANETRVAFTSPVQENGLIAQGATTGRVETGGRAGANATPTTTEALPTGAGGGTGTAVTAASSAFAPTALTGWDQTKWSDTTHDTIKYVAGRVLSNYAPGDWLNPTKQAEIIAAWKAAGLNPTITGKDTVDFNDGAGSIDILKGYNAGGEAWRWGNQAAEAERDAARAAASTGTTTPGTTTTGTSTEPLSAAIEQILASVFGSAFGTGTTAGTTTGLSNAGSLGTLYNSIVSNPETMDAATIAKLKEQQKEDLLGVRQQLMEKAAQDAASRGMYNSGWVDSQNLAANDAFTSDLLKAYRDIETQAGQTNYENRLAALNTAAPIYEFSQTLPLNWFQALNNALLGRYNYGLELSTLQNQMQEYLGNWLLSSTE